jgi:hypothetical protein
MRPNEIGGPVLNTRREVLMSRRVFSAMLFLVGLGVLVLCTGTVFFRLTALDLWLTAAMAAFGLIICVLSLAMLATGPKSPAAGRQSTLYGAALFLLGFANILLGIVAVFFGLPAAGAGLGVAVAALGLLLCILSAAFMAAGS